MFPHCTPEDAARFWALVDRSGNCWYWRGPIHHEGYGQFSIDGKSYRAHRIAYALTYGSITPSLCVLHDCDNPPCCNPAHLFEGTRGENNHDRHRKGRDAKGAAHGARTHPEQFVKVTSEMIATVSRLWYEEGFSHRQIADMIGLSHVTVWRIVRKVGRYRC